MFLEKVYFLEKRYTFLEKVLDLCMDTTRQQLTFAICDINILSSDRCGKNTSAHGAGALG